MKRGQGAFEYILMLSGVLLIVILIILIMRGTLLTANNSMQNTENQYAGIATIQLVDNSTINLFVAENGNGITNAPCCSRSSGSNGLSCMGKRGSTATNCTALVISCASKQFDNMTGTCAG